MQRRLHVCLNPALGFWSLQGRLNELMSQIRMQNHYGAVRAEERYNVDTDLLREIKQVSDTRPLQQQQQLFIRPKGLVLIR